jgi:hypothetical protein
MRESHQQRVLVLIEQNQYAHSKNLVDAASELEFLVQVYTENLLAHAFPSLDLKDNLRIRRTLNSEVKEINNQLGLSGLLLMNQNAQCHVIEMCMEAGGIDAQEIQEAREKIQSVHLCLLLSFERLVKTIGEHVKLGPLPQIGHSSDYADYCDPYWSSLVCLLHRFRLDLPNNEFQSFRKYWLRFDAIKKPYFLDVSTARFVMAVDMAGLPGKQLYRFVDYVTSMEALLLEGGAELSFRMANRMAALLVGTPEDHQNVWEFMREAYDFRSALVHGSEPPPIEIQRAEKKVQISLEEALGRLHSYSRRSIRLMIDLIDLMSREHPLFPKLNDNNKKKLILDLLDLSLLRDDLRECLGVFLETSQKGGELLACFEKARMAVFHASLLEEYNRK